MEVYMDNAATTRAYPEVVQLMNKIMEEDYGNPSSLHMKGVEAERYIRRAREILAGILNPIIWQSLAEHWRIREQASI